MGLVHFGFFLQQAHFTYHLNFYKGRIELTLCTEQGGSSWFYPVSISRSLSSLPDHMNISRS